MASAVSSWVRIQCSFHGYRAVVTFSLTTSSRAPRLTGPHNHSSLLTHARGCSEGVHSVQLTHPNGKGEACRLLHVLFISSATTRQIKLLLDQKGTPELWNARLTEPHNRNI